MPRLYLLRHGMTAIDGDDPPLSDEGILRMEREARGMERLGLSFDLILASPLRRARQTARIIAGRFGLDGAVRICEEAGPGCRLPWIAPAIAREAGDGLRARAVLIVGHQPDMGRLVKDLSLAGQPPPFGRGTLACFEAAAWPPEPPCAMIFLMPAEDLERAGAEDE